MIFKRKLRHVLVEATSGINLADKEAESELLTCIRDSVGEIAYFRMNPRISAQLSDNVFVISVNRGHEREVALALAFIKMLGGERMGFYTIKTSGTIMSLKDHFARLYAKH